MDMEIVGVAYTAANINLELNAGDSVKVIVTRNGVETVEMDATVPAGKSLSNGRLLIRGELV